MRRIDLNEEFSNKPCWISIKDISEDQVFTYSHPKNHSAPCIIELDHGKILTGKPVIFDGKNPWVSGSNFPFNQSSSMYGGLHIGYWKPQSHRIHGAAIYGNIYHQHTPFMLVYINVIYMDPMGMTSRSLRRSSSRLVSKWGPLGRPSPRPWTGPWRLWASHRGGGFFVVFQCEKSDVGNRYSYMAMAISYKWWFLWDDIFYKWG